MFVKFVLPALTEATSPLFRPIKYSLFPPLGLATLAAYLKPEDRAVLTDEHVEKLRLDDEPDVVAIEVYITSARRSYEIADSYRRRGVFVAIWWAARHCVAGGSRAARRRYFHWTRGGHVAAVSG